MAIITYCLRRSKEKEESRTKEEERARRESPQQRASEADEVFIDECMAGIESTGYEKPARSLSHLLETFSSPSRSKRGENAFSPVFKYFLQPVSSLASYREAGGFCRPGRGGLLGNAGAVHD